MILFICWLLQPLRLTTLSCVLVDSNSGTLRMSYFPFESILVFLLYA